MHLLPMDAIGTSASCE